MIRLPLPFAVLLALLGAGMWVILFEATCAALRARHAAWLNKPLACSISWAVLLLFALSCGIAWFLINLLICFPLALSHSHLASSRPGVIKLVEVCQNIPAAFRALFPRIMPYIK